MKLPGETKFRASPRTPINNNLMTPLDTAHSFVPLVGVDLINNNPNNKFERARQRQAQRNGRVEPVPPIGRTGADRRPGS